MRDSPPPVPEDARRRAANRAHAEAQKKKKDTKEARRNKKILEREALEKRRRCQKQDGLPVELSPSLSEDSLGEDDEFELGRGPLDYLPDVGETVPGASVSSPALPWGGGGGAPGRRSLTPRPRLIRPSYGHWGSVPLAHWARQ